MNKFSDYKEEIYKCSRCGLCQSVCPVYKATLSECAVSKGKFNMLNGVVKGDLSFSKQLKKYLDLCTGCNACKDFCPSDIDAKKIFVAAKQRYYEENNLSRLESFFNSYLVFKVILRLAAAFLFFYRLFGFNKITGCLEKPISKTGKPGKLLLLLNSQVRNFINKEKTPDKIRQKEKTALYFEGCFNKYINNQTETAVKKIFYNSGISFIKKDFECCGVSYLADGNIEEFRKIAEKNIAAAEGDFDYILTDCASCLDTIKTYPDVLSSESAAAFAQKTVSVIDLIRNKSFICSENLKIAIHIPCHEEFDLVGFVKKIKNIEYVKAVNFDKCCGFSGTFALKYPEISEKISKSKALNYINSGADMVLTTCPACILGLEQGFIETGIAQHKRPVVMNLFVFLAKYCGVENI